MSTLDSFASVIKLVGDISYSASEVKDSSFDANLESYYALKEREASQSC